MLLSEYDQSAVEKANAALNKILGIYLAREIESPKPSPPHGSLFHYTSAEGLKGIIEKNELWATSAYFLNDSSEITYGYGLLKEVLDEWLAKNQRDERLLSVRLAQDLRKSFGEDLLNMLIIKPIYLACFCEEDNLLSQWRSYGQFGGYSLGFKVPTDPTIGQGFKPEANTYTSKWVRVDYERTSQRKKCMILLESLLPIFDDPNTNRAFETISSHPQLGYSKVRTVIADILLEEIVGFKNKAFEVEKEWRVVVRQRELVKQGSDDGGKTPLPVHFRSSMGAVTPYLRLLPTKAGDRLPIASVRSGPTLNRTTAGMAVRLMLEKHGFSTVRVEGSDISVRF